MPQAAFQSEIDPLRLVLLKHSRDAFVNQGRIERQWRALGWAGPPDPAAAEAEYDRFLALLRGFDVETLFLPRSAATGLDSIYTRDAAVVCAEGAILCNMGKAARRAEPAEVAAALEASGFPVRGRIVFPGHVECGDAVWLDRRTLAVGRGYRTDAEGIRQLERLVLDLVDELLVVDLPHWRGPDHVLHLMSILSPLDRDLAAIYSPLMPVGFRRRLLDRGIRPVEVPDEEFESMGCNLLAVAPRRCLALAGNPITRRRLEAAGVEVFEYSGLEIGLRGSGGPTCLARPLVRG